MPKLSHGGFRIGSGRKKGAGSTVLRVPNSILTDVLLLISNSKIETCNENQNTTKDEGELTLDTCNAIQELYPLENGNVNQAPNFDPLHKPRNPQPKNHKKRMIRAKKRGNQAP